MPQRYFLTTEATYETLRQGLNTQLAYPNSLGKSVFQTALYAPRDGFRRILLAVDTGIPNYAAISSAISPLLDTDAAEEIDEATYLAAVASATAGASAWGDITGKPTEFPPASHTHSADSVFVEDGTFNNVGQSQTSVAQSFENVAAFASNASSITQGTLAALRLPFATTNARGAVIVGTGLGVSTGTVSVSYGTTAGTACQGNDSRLSDARTPTAHKSSHATGGADALTASDIGAAATSHAHGNLTSAGLIGSNTASGQIVVTTTGGALTTADAAAARTTLGLGTEGLSFSYTGPAAADLLPLNDTSQAVPYRFALPDGTALYSGGRTAGPSDVWPPLNATDLGSGRITSLSTNATSTPAGILTQVSFQTISNLVSFSAPDLVMSGSFGASNATFPNLTTLSFPELVLTKGSMIGTFNVLTALSFPKLRFAGSFSITANAATTVSFPVLESATGNIGGTYNAVTSISFPELRTCGGISVSSTALTTLAIPKLRTMSGSFSPATPLLATLTLPPLGQWKVLASSLSLTSGSLPQGSVDALLAHLAYMDGNNDTLAYGSSRVVQITGSNAAPSNLGSVTVTLATSPTLPNLVCSGTTCTVNMTAHGYAVGDVLRVSGVTGATNANRYAVVQTVPTANQFTYTTVNTATPTNGAGTMNIVKASNNVKTLVTRGVSLTTM